MTKLVLKVKGMHCASCSMLIDKLVGKASGVSHISTNYGAERTVIEFDESKTNLTVIDTLFNKIGYDLIRPDEEGGELLIAGRKEERRITEAKRRVIASFVLSAPIVIYYMLIHMFNLPHVHQVAGGKP